MGRTFLHSLGSALLVFLASVSYCAGQTNEAGTAGAADPASILVANETTVQSAPTDANGWEKLGTDYLKRENMESARALQKALDNGFPPQTGKYNLACAYARMGDKQKAIDPRPLIRHQSRINAVLASGCQWDA